MPNENPIIVFEQSAGFEENIQTFGTFLADLDPQLGEGVQDVFPAMQEGSYDLASIWNDLYERAAPRAQEPLHEALVACGVVEVTNSFDTSFDGIVELASQAPISLANSTANSRANAVSGWLLAGISIEGFRGINNAVSPLELKFNIEKINSVSAVNGVGKSSIYDAIRYAIKGKLPWLDNLPVTEQNKDYYLNRFHPDEKGTIKLKLVAEPTGATVEITIIRDKAGTRTVTASDSADGATILKALNREFVLLDGPTFQEFISSKPLDRGRIFAGLLGLSDYSKFRQSLAALANTRAFNNHFSVGSHEDNKCRDERSAKETRSAIARDYESLVGEPLTDIDTASAQTKCHEALAQIVVIKDHCIGKSFDQIDINSCVETTKVAEGGPKRERLSAVIRERAELAKQAPETPTADGAASLTERARERDDAVEKTSGTLMLDLFQSGAKALAALGADNTHVCPLCDSHTSFDMNHHVAAKLAQFAHLEEATNALAREWDSAGWPQIQPLELTLESDNSLRIINNYKSRCEAGQITQLEAKELVAWLETLRRRAEVRDKELANEQNILELELPPSLVEVTTKIEAARRLQENWNSLNVIDSRIEVEKTRATRVSRVKVFLDKASSAFGAAESEISKARLTSIEPIFHDYFKTMSFYGVTPAVTKRANSEDLQIRLIDFFGIQDISPQAVLSESYRNAFAISLYLAAASLFGGMPKFIVLDDVTSSFDAGHQLFLVELLRTVFARPGKSNGLQVILLSHDTMLEKLFNKHTGSGFWFHQRLEGMPQTIVLPQAGAVNKVRDLTIKMLSAGQVSFAQDGIRQYLEYRLNELITRLRIPVPIDVAFTDNKRLCGEYLSAIDAAVKLHQAAGSLILTAQQIAGLNTSMATIVANYLAHWSTGQAMTFTAQALLGVMAAIDAYCDCFTHQPTPSTARVFYKSLSAK